MEHLTVEERAEWIEDAIDALRGRLLIRPCDAVQAYTELSRLFAIHSALIRSRSCPEWINEHKM